MQLVNKMSNLAWTGGFSGFLEIENKFTNDIYYKLFFVTRLEECLIEK